MKKIYFSGDPQNFLPGLPSSLEDDYLFLLGKTGYKKRGVVYDLYQNISNFDIPPRISYGISQKKLNLKLHAEKVTKEIEFLLLEFLKKYFPGRWYFEAENIRRIPGGIEDYWLLWCNNVPIGFARTKKKLQTYDY